MKQPTEDNKWSGWGERDLLFIVALLGLINVALLWFWPARLYNQGTMKE